MRRCVHLRALEWSNNASECGCGDGSRFALQLHEFSNKAAIARSTLFVHRVECRVLEIDRRLDLFQPRSDRLAFTLNPPGVVPVSF